MTPRGESGFTLTELLVASAVSLVVVGAAGLLADGLQRVATAIDGEYAARMDADYTVDAIVRAIEQAGSLPYGITDAACVGGGVEPLQLDPNGDGRPDDIRVRMDVNPPNGRLGGHEPACDDTGEDVTLALDRRAGTVMRRDGTSRAAPVPLSSGAVTDLQFELLDAEGRVGAAAATARAVRVTLATRPAGTWDGRPRTRSVVAWLRER